MCFSPKRDPGRRAAELVTQRLGFGRDVRDSQRRGDQLPAVVTSGTLRLRWAIADRRFARKAVLQVLQGQGPVDGEAADV